MTMSLHPLVLCCSGDVMMMSLCSSRGAVEFLCNEGHIYSTIDDEHFKSTEA